MRAWIVIVWMLAMVPSPAEAQQLRRASSAMRAVPTQPAPQRRSRARATSAPWRAPRVASVSAPAFAYSSGSRRRGPSIFHPFSRYPHADGSTGYGIPGGRARWAAQIGVDGSWVLDDSGRTSVDVRVLAPVVLDLQLEYAFYLEQLRSGGVDWIALGKLGVGARVIQTRDVHLAIGVAVRHWQDVQSPLVGGAATLALDVFAPSPLVLSLRGALSLFEHAWLGEARITVGIVIDHVEIAIGWQHLQITALEGGVSVPLTGPLLAFRAWL